MHITFVGRSTPLHQHGGMERVSWDLARELAAQHAVTFVTTSLPPLHQRPDASKDLQVPDAGTSFVVEGITVHPLPGTRPGQGDKNWQRVLATRRDLAAGDVILSVSVGAEPWLGSDALPPVVHQNHGTWVMNMRGSIRRLALWEILRSLGDNPLRVLAERRALSRYGAVVAVGTPVQQSLESRWYKSSLPGPVQLIPNGVDTRRFRPDPEARQAFRQRLGIPAEAPVAAIVGRLQAEKGVTQAAAAAGQLEGMHVLLGGVGPEQRAAERSARSHHAAVYVLGAVPDEDLPMVYQAADVHVLATKRMEGLPTTVLEALACGTPVVLSEHAIDPILRGSCVVPVNPADVGDIKKGIQEALSMTPGTAVLPPGLDLATCASRYEAVFRSVSRDESHASRSRTRSAQS